MRSVFKRINTDLLSKCIRLYKVWHIEQYLHAIIMEDVMKRLRFNQAIVIILIAFSFFFFILQYLLFHNLKEEMFLLFQDLTFLPIEILLVTFILDRVLRGREKQERLQQVRIVISAFFSEIGTDALVGISGMIAGSEHLKNSLDMKASWVIKDFDSASEAVKTAKLHAEPDAKRLSLFAMR